MLMSSESSEAPAWPQRQDALFRKGPPMLKRSLPLWSISRNPDPERPTPIIFDPFKEKTFMDLDVCIRMERSTNNYNLLLIHHELNTKYSELQFKTPFSSVSLQHLSSLWKQEMRLMLRENTVMPRWVWGTGHMTSTSAKLPHMWDAEWPPAVTTAS